MPVFLRIGASQHDNWLLHLSIITGSVCSIIETLGYSQVCSKWVPRSLTADHKIRRKTISSELLERFDAEGEACLSRIVTGIEAVRNWLRMQDKSWYRQGIHALVPHWRKAVQVDGDYVEK
jgi:hypothetical protein